MSRRPTAEERRELGAFLASRRAGLRPADFGLPEGPRRTPGLRREEIALLAGMSPSWYTWLEQGRDIQASPDTLRRLAGVLKLNRVESDHLFALASREAPAVVAGGEIGEGLEMLVNAISMPAYIRNTRFDILAWNDAIAKLFVDYGALQVHERNTLRLMFLYKPYRTLILDWEQMARGTLSAFRAARAQAQDKRPFDSLVEELTELSAEFALWWKDTHVQGFDEGEKRLLHPDGGHIQFHYVALTPAGRPDLSLVTYIPRPAAYDSRS
ncbi:helix-turn-helix transcriptional regulator [Paraburkholderia sp. ZP32-5]|uniref:helix-turn-helix transcriptional regulator n=1 Tax=Paraburkholderia sp. ZP32-5 TaxID=2883245 RepID=UPI001F3BB967|nr:helix-turn-helix transcriptional regulator [Paraburkholderia sp. ZP32-5]